MRNEMRWEAVLIYHNIIRKAMTALAVAFLFVPVVAQEEGETVVPIEYGDMEQWVTRKIHESAIIGGNTKTLYELGPTQEIDGNKAYVSLGGSPWGNSNVMAKVMGVVKTNVSVYPEERDGGLCARLETHIEKVKVLGLINITVLASGSLFLGDMKEPITGTKEGEKAFNAGVPFTGRPKAVRFDYKTKMSGEANRIHQMMNKKTVVPGQDCCIMTLILQNRTEDAKGNIIAKRVGTACIKYDKTEDWHNGATYEIHYGDISHTDYYDEELMMLGVGNYHARNSKEESKLIDEIGWADPNDTPTHLLIQFTSSLGGAFIGSPGNMMWVDNVELVY